MNLPSYTTTHPDSHNAHRLNVNIFISKYNISQSMGYFDVGSSSQTMPASPSIAHKTFLGNAHWKKLGTCTILRKIYTKHLFFSHFAYLRCVDMIISISFRGKIICKTQF